MNPKPCNRRRGMVLLFVLAVIAIATVRMVTLARTMVAVREELQTQAWRLQAGWLARSGLQRAVTRLADKPDYAGETWKIAADEIGGPEGTAVRIDVRVAGRRAWPATGAGRGRLSRFAPAPGPRKPRSDRRGWFGGTKGQGGSKW